MNEPILWSPGTTLEQIEKEVILRAFRFYRSNKTATANSLGIAIRTLDSKLEKYQQEGKEQDELLERERAAARDFVARQRGNVQTDPQTGTNVYGPAAGQRVEPAAHVTAKQPMPVQERQEIQNVLPKQTSQGHTKKAR